jgi:hypothetical protein
MQLFARAWKEERLASLRSKSRSVFTDPSREQLAPLRKKGASWVETRRLVQRAQRGAKAHDAQ